MLFACAFGNTIHFIAILSYFSVTLYSYSKRHTETLTQNNSLRVYSWMSVDMSGEVQYTTSLGHRNVNSGDLHLLLSFELCPLEILWVDLNIFLLRWGEQRKDTTSLFFPSLCWYKNLRHSFPRTWSRF